MTSTTTTPKNTLKQDVAAIITAMTDDEELFLQETLNAILSDPGIGQAILCVEEKNTWAESVLGSLTTDPRLEIIRIPMAPQAVARNQCLLRVKLPWVAYCDGDDVWCNGKTATQRAYADQTRADIVGADHYLVDEAGTIRSYAMARFIPMPSSWLVKTEIMQQYQFDESLKPGDEDGEWWIRTGAKISRVRYATPLIRYRVRPGSVSSATPSKRRKARIVQLASVPVLGSLVMFVTWCIWVLTRQDQYVWLPSWGEPKPL